MDLQFDNEMGFNNDNHVVNHLNYLFRTDSAQKWTNELTHKNIALIFDEKDKFTVELFVDELTERKALVKRVTGILDETTHGDISHLFMSRTEFYDNDVFSFDDEMLKTMSEIVSMAMTIEGIRLIAVVTHEDQKQNYVHFHMLYVNESAESLPVAICDMRS